MTTCRAAGTFASEFVYSLTPALARRFTTTSLTAVPKTARGRGSGVTSDSVRSRMSMLSARSAVMSASSYSGSGHTGPTG